MTSLKGKMMIWMVRNRHLMRGQLKREVVTFQSSIPEMRKQHMEGAKKMGAMPAGVQVKPVSIPGLPDGYAAEWIYPTGGTDAPKACVKAIFYTHGGGYVSGNCEDHRMHVAKFVLATGVGALLYDYRLAPEHPFPAGMEDTLCAYRWLLDQGVSASDILILGESAGGGLCLAALNAIRDSGLPLPAAGAALSPWTDLTCQGGSYKTNARRDISTLGSWEVWGSYYVGGNDPRHPWISPLYGDLRGLPPVLIEVGDYEILLDDSLAYAKKASEVGVEMELHVWPEMVHCFPLFAPMFTEATQAWEEVIAFIRKHLQLEKQPAA